ncbi:MAG: hypothetical protein HOE90_05950 [Bacteriovoracaceae bacterium]|jgi:RNAse (barnase) inhibitor barstar|nr:hypothetical protein [Bacteriovoracaceae bacterium]
METISRINLIRSPSTICAFEGKSADLKKTLLNVEAISFFEIDCLQCNTEQNLFSTFSTELGFPEYFGRNWDALHECIGDLDWLDAKYIILFLKNSNKLLIDQPDKIKTFAEITSDIIKEQAREFNEPEISIVLDNNSQQNTLLSEIEKK